MALSLTSIGNFLFKKNQGKSSTNDARQFFEEPIDGRGAVFPSQVWAQGDLILATAPTLADQATSGVVKKFVQLQLSAVAGTTNAFFHASLKDCIPFNFGDGSYNYALVDSGGTAIPFGAGDWIVDPAVGTLTFYGTVPSNMPPKITFFQYVGAKGLASQTPNSVTFTEQTTDPAAPAAGFDLLYFKAGPTLFAMNNAGIIRQIATLTGTETLSNKTLTAPTVDIEKFTDQSAAPATPAAGTTVLYTQGRNLMMIDSTGTIKQQATLTGTETFTNKTLTSPILDIANFTDQTVTPATPAAGTTLLYSQNKKLMLIDSTGTVKALGSGGGGVGGKNYLSDYYDGSSVSGIVLYNQAVAYTFAGTDNKVDLVGDAINYTAHPYATGQVLAYTAGTTAIGGLTSGTTYYAVKLTANVFGLATTIDNAMAKRLIDLTSQGSGTHTFQAGTSGVSSGSGTAASGITATINTTLPIRNPSNIRLSKDAQNRIGMNYAFPLTLDRADVDIGRPLKLAFKLRTSANFTAVSGFPDATVQVYDLDNNIVPQLDGLYLQQLPVALTTTGIQFQFTPSAGGYNYRFIVSIENVNANAFDLDISDLEISSAAGQVPGVFATPMRTVGATTIGVTSGTAPTKGTVVVDKVSAGRVADYLHLNVQYKQSAAGTAGTSTSDALYTLPNNLQFDPARVTFNADIVNNGATSWDTKNAYIAGGISDAISSSGNSGVLWVIPFDATRYRMGVVWSSGTSSSRGLQGGSVFSYGAALSYSIDVMLPILGWDASATYSTSEIALKNTPTSAISSTKTGTLTAAYMAMTGNSLTLQPGMYDLGGTMDFNNSGTSPAYTNTTTGWYATNGADTTTVPAALTTIAGLSILGGTATLVQPTAGAIITTQAPELTIRLTQVATIYLVPSATATTIANARVTAYPLANKRPDYSAFGVYGQVDIRSVATPESAPFNAAWTAFTNSTLVLPIGTWRLVGSIWWYNNGSNPGYTNIAMNVFGAGGTNTSTRPALLSSLANVVTLSGGIPGYVGGTIASTTDAAGFDKSYIVRVTSGTITVGVSGYFVAATPGNARCQAYLSAEKLQ